MTFNEQKLVRKALESFWGLGPQTALRLLAKHSVHPRAKMGGLPQRTMTALTAELGAMVIESDAKKIVNDNIVRLREMNAYRGRRHAMGLPVRGQNTRGQILTARKLNRVPRFWYGS